MRVIVIGNDAFEIELSRELINKGHEVTIIDSTSSNIDSVTDLLNVKGIVGEAFKPSVLKKANIDIADVVICINEENANNILAGSLAKKLGAKNVIVRLKNYDDELDVDYLEKSFHLDYLLDENYLVSNEINRLIEMNNITNSNKILMNVYACEVVVGENNSFLNKYLKDLRFDNVLIGSVDRSGTFFIPKGDFLLQNADKISLVGTLDNIKKCLEENTSFKSSTKHLLIIGGGKNGYYIAKKASDNKTNTTILEYNLERCLELSNAFPKFKVLKADGANASTLDNILKEEKYDCVVAASGRDDTNLIASMYAKTMNVEKIITELTDFSYAKLFHDANISSTLSSKYVLINEILRIVQSISNKHLVNNTSKMMSCERLYNDGCFSMAFEVLEDFKFLNIEFKDERFNLVDDCIIASIVRKNNTIIPNGKSMLKPNDKIIVMTTNKKINSLEDIFK